MVRDSDRHPVGSGWLLLLVILPGSLLAAVAYRAVSARDARSLDAAFRFDASQRAHRIVQQTANHLGAVDLLLALYKSSGHVSSSRFQAFCNAVVRQEKATIGLGWCPRVARADLTRHETQVRSEGFPAYRVAELDGPGKPVPAKERAEYFPIVFAVPKNALLWQGVDLSCEPIFREGIEQARDTGRQTVTRSFVSPNLPDRSRMVAVISPFYGAARVPDSVEMRPKHLLGMLISVIDAATLMEEGVEDPDIRGIDIYLFDNTDPKAPALVASTLSNYRYFPGEESIPWPAQNTREPSYRRPCDVAGRSWVVYCVPTDRYLADRRGWSPLSVAVALLLLTAGVALYVNSLRGQTAEVERVVDKRTAELRQANEHLRQEAAVRRKAESSLAEERNHLREVLDILENDRRIVAYEIHDGFVQKSIASLMMLQSLRLQWAEAPEIARKNLDAAVDLVAESIGEARQLIGGLRPKQLDDQGVAAAMESLVDAMRRRCSAQIELVQRLRFDRLAPALETAIFRIVQESLTNALKHSQSPRVRIELAQPNGTVQIEIRDWGRGFDPDRVAADRHGLEGIRERTRLFGGTLALQSQPGQGTCIRVELPLSGPNGRGDSQ
jgi:signal transduction histidine kinase